MTTPFRLTTSTRLVLAALQDADRPLWGFAICRRTGLQSGTIYPILNRLAEHGWVETWDETSPHPGRPPRRFYQLTDHGRRHPIPASQDLPAPVTEAHHRPRGDGRMTEWTPPPPGDTREQLPNYLLALIDIPPYLSTACQTAGECERVVDVHVDLSGELSQTATRLHARCRINQKYTGQLCTCGCHQSA